MSKAIIININDDKLKKETLDSLSCIIIILEKILFCPATAEMLDLIMGIREQIDPLFISNNKHHKIVRKCIKNLKENKEK